MPDPNSRDLVDQFLAGDSRAAAEIFDRYVERLLALIRSRLASKLASRLDPEDVVQSAYRSFFVRAADEQYHFERSGDLWRLLAKTALNKLYGQVERQTAAKRTVDRESAAEQLTEHLAHSAAPDLAEVVAVTEQLRLLMQDLTIDERAVLTATLQGQSLVDVGEAIGKSPRTVRRLLANAKQHFEERLLERSVAERPQPPDEPDLPLKFSDFVLQKLLGSGGMGKVFRAVDKRSGQTVAVKALHKKRHSEPRAVAQFVQESQILAELDHENIVGFRGLGRFPGGSYFMVMDFVDGFDLQSRLSDGALAVNEAIAVVTAVAQAVHHAHQRGVVHCDLKPANVLIDRFGNVRVTDFGFAFLIANDSADATGGTAGFMAPEIALFKRPTPAADIYGLGALLWMLLTGSAPHIQSDIATNDPKLTSLARICQRCLAPDPGNRFASAADLSDRLAKWSSEQAER